MVTCSKNLGASNVNAEARIAGGISVAHSESCGFRS